MPYTHRTPEQRAALEQQARALRLAGASMAEIERATGVPVPTLYQWAARGGWRACDLAREALSEIPADPREGRDLPQDRALDDRESSLSSGPSGRSGSHLPRAERALAAGGCSPCDADGVGVHAPAASHELSDGLERSKPGEGASVAPDGPDGPEDRENHSQGEQPPAASARTRPTGWAGGQERLTPSPSGSQGEQPPAASARTRPTGGEGGQETNVSADALRSAGERALAAALQLAQAGQAKAARDQLLLGQRFVAAAEDLARFETEESVDARQQQADYEVAKVELEKRLLHLIDYEDRKRGRAIGLDQIEGLDLDTFDFEPFRIGEDDWRPATPEELARIRASLNPS